MEKQEVRTMTKEELRRRVEARAKTLKDIFNHDYYYCECCEQPFTHAVLNDDGEELCPECGEEIRTANFLDYLYNNNEGNIEFRVRGKSHNFIRSVFIFTDLGGPNIYVDTDSNIVEGKWGCDTVTVHFDSEIGDQIDAEFDEIWRDS